MKHDIASWTRQHQITPSWNSVTFHPPTKGNAYNIRIGELLKRALYTYSGEWLVHNEELNCGVKLQTTDEIFWYGVL